MGIDSTYPIWLANLLAKGLVHDPLSKTAAVNNISAVRQRLRAAARDVAALDTSEMGRDGVSKWLLSLSIDPRTTVVLLWPSDRVGAHIRYDEFAKNYDELWFPSTDDVWLLDPASDWILELDHEELFTLRRAQKLSGDWSET